MRSIGDETSAFGLRRVTDIGFRQVIRKPELTMLQFLTPPISLDQNSANLHSAAARRTSLADR